MKSMIIVNFGGPRSLSEVESFLITLLTDRDVIRTKLPNFIHNWFFTKIAKKRAEKVAHDYSLIGGKSPIFEDTEVVAKMVSQRLDLPVSTFHRYLIETHSSFLQKASLIDEKTVIFPMFPQFSFATTGSIARFFTKHMDTKYFHWIKSYANHPAFTSLLQNNIRSYLEQHDLKEEETILLFSAHGLPRDFVTKGDIYEKECNLSFEAIQSAFPNALSRLSYQSKFGRGEWLRPYTDEVCRDILTWSKGRKNVIIIPLSFTSDHVETLFEVEYQYLPPIQSAGLFAYRLPAPNRSEEWINTIISIVNTSDTCSTKDLIY